MRLAPVFVLPLLAPLWVSCGAWSTLPLVEGRALVPLPIVAAEGELEVQPGRADRAPLRSTLPYANRATILGYGGVQMWARPERDELIVGAIVDAPSKEARWRSCRGATLVFDGERLELPTTYIGAPMEGGVYDAVRVELRIDQVRRMARARSLRGDVCGDPIELGAPQRGTIRRFVEWFDRIATPARTEDAPVFRDVGPSLDVLPNEELEPGPHPA